MERNPGIVVFQGNFVEVESIEEVEVAFPEERMRFNFGERRVRAGSRWWG